MLVSWSSRPPRASRSFGAVAIVRMAIPSTYVLCMKSAKRSNVDLIEGETSTWPEEPHWSGKAVQRHKHYEQGGGVLDAPEQVLSLRHKEGGTLRR